MRKDVAEQLQAIVVTIGHHIEVLRRLGCNDAARILAIARLDLQTKIHGISEEELKAVCDALDPASVTATSAQVIDMASRATRKA